MTQTNASGCWPLVAAWGLTTQPALQPMTDIFVTQKGACGHRASDGTLACYCISTGTSAITDTVLSLLLVT